MALHNLVDSLMIIPLDLKVGYIAIALSGADLAMPQKILDDNQIGIGIQQLSSHRVPQLKAVLNLTL
jgi:hypothetical protein